MNRPDQGEGHTDPLAGRTGLTGRRWRMRATDEAAIRSLAQRHGLSDLLSRSLVGRGVTAENAEDFLRPTMRRLFPDPSSFADMDAAASAIVDAFEQGAAVHVLADYDVDGASSAALLVRWFRHMGQALSLYVPDRLTEGYGPSALAFDRMKAAGADLIITVDCGAAATDAIDHARRIGLKVVVIDHHLMREAPPDCLAVVNPNRPDCKSGQGNLAAAGVVFVLLAALNREARRRGLFSETPEPDLQSWLDLAALGAICDVTALTGFNRLLAQRGLEVMSGWNNSGLRGLMQVAGASLDPATTYHAGFVLGPRINAGGRIGQSDLGARLLSSDDPEEIRTLSAQLDDLNKARREVERDILDQAIRQVEALGDPVEGPAVIIAAHADWHPGVVGIVAGRLRERWRKPVIVIGLDPITGMGRGSGRSQPGINLGRAVQKAYEAGLLVAGGGHAMAAGLTVEATRIDALRQFLNTEVAAQAGQTDEGDDLLIDAVLDPASATRPLYEQIQVLAPFGQGNPEPMFLLDKVQINDARVVGQDHVSVRLSGPDGASIRAIAWRCSDLPLGKALLAGAGGVQIAGRLKPDDWNGRKGVQFEIEDLSDPRRV